MNKTGNIFLIMMLFLSIYKVAYPLEPEMIVIPAGEFTMGDNLADTDERPAHKVYLDTYSIGKFEVTNLEYREFVEKMAYNPPEGFSDPEYSQPNQPVAGVSWFDTEAYIKWLNSVTKKFYRLPTEAEWEKAARGKDERKFPWGNDMPNAGGGFRANYRANDLYDQRGEDRFWDSAPVGSFETGKSPYGIYDMAGNIWEWCSDWFDKDYYKTTPAQNPQGPDNGTFKILRGGSWLNAAIELRITNRISEYPDDIVINYGFRLVEAGKQRSKEGKK